MTGRHFGARLYKTHRSDHRRFADPRVIHHYRVHPDEDVGAELRAVNDRAMPDVAIDPDNAIEARHAVQGAIVLHVRSLADDDSSKIAPQRRAGADIASFLDDHVADQNGFRVNEAERMNDRRHTVNRIDLQADRLHGIAPAGMTVERRPGFRAHGSKSEQ